MAASSTRLRIRKCKQKQITLREQYLYTSNIATTTYNKRVDRPIHSYNLYLTPFIALGLL